MQPFKYNSDFIPDEYHCGKCGKNNVRLWREYSCFNPDILCFQCAETRGRRNHADEPNWQSPFSRGEGDHIGWFVPYVPCEDGSGSWGYGGVPNAGVNWWYSLPV